MLNLYFESNNLKEYSSKLNYNIYLNYHKEFVNYLEEKINPLFLYLADSNKKQFVYTIFKKIKILNENNFRKKEEEFTISLQSKNIDDKNKYQINLCNEIGVYRNIIKVNYIEDFIRALNDVIKFFKLEEVLNEKTN